MPEKIDDLLPTAREIQKQAALKEAEKADEYARLQAAAEAEKRALIDKLSKPSGLSEDEKVKLASTVIQRAVRNGLTEVQVYRFPNSLCTDNGRAINQHGTRLGKDADGNSEGDLPALVRLFASRAATASATRSLIFRAAFPATSASSLSWGD